MGVKKLYKLLEKYAPNSIKINKMKDYNGKKIAIDGNIILYQFMIAILNKNNQGFVNKKGEETSHLHIIFYKTISYLNNGIIPVYVFDGRPPEIKKQILKERKNLKEKAKQKLSKTTSLEENIKYSKRLVNITNKHIDDCIELLKIMGIPCIKAHGEADSQCAALALSGLVDGVASEDMDLLAFGTPILLRDFSSKKDVREINLINAIKGLGLMDENNINPYEKFIELCILLKCDYCPIIKGVGYETAFKLISKEGSISSIINVIKNKNKYPKLKLPYNYLEKYLNAKKYFKEAIVIDPYTIELDWKEPNKDEILNILCNKNDFSKKKIKSNLKIIMQNYKLYLKSLK